MIHPVIFIIKIMGNKGSWRTILTFPSISPIMICPRNAVVDIYVWISKKHFHWFFKQFMSIKPIMIHCKTINSIIFSRLTLPFQSFYV